MKQTLLLLLAAIILASCGLTRPNNRNGKCRPSPGSPDYAVQQWIKKKKDGSYTVTTIHGLRDRTVNQYDCRPDSATLANL